MIRRNIPVIILLTLTYSILRYNIFGNIPYTDIPTLIINKAVSFSMIIILIPALVCRIKGQSDDYYSYLHIFKKFAIIHVLISVSILSQNYYPKFFENEKLTLNGNLALLTGVLSFAYILNKKYRIRNGVLYLLIAGHLFFIGYKGWFDIEKWNGIMPPITLICFLILLVLLVLPVFNKKLPTLFVF